MTPRVLVVGGGLTSAVTSCLLREELQSACQLTVWDKARGAGGRLSTSRGPAGCGSVDLGAQYVTVSPDCSQRHQRIYSELTSAGVLAPLTAPLLGLRAAASGTLQLVAAAGSSALVKHFLRRGQIQPEFSQLVTELSTEGSTCAVQTAAGRRETFDVVVLTMPPPQILALGGSIRETIAADSSLLSALRSVQYSARYALGLFWDRPAALPVPWGAQYVTGHPAVRYVAVDNVKRGQDAAPTSAVIHTSVEFGAAHVEMTPEEVQPILERHVAELFPDWPPATAVKCQKWRYSQVVTPFPGSPGCAVLSPRPLVLAAGDAFTHSNVDGCLTSAEKAAQAVTEYVRKLTAG